MIILVSRENCLRGYVLSSYQIQRFLHFKSFITTRIYHNVEILMATLMFSPFRSPTADEVSEMMPLTDDSFGERSININDKDFSVSINTISQVLTSMRWWLTQYLIVIYFEDLVTQMLRTFNILKSFTSFLVQVHNRKIQVIQMSKTFTFST